MYWGSELPHSGIPEAGREKLRSNGTRVKPPGRCHRWDAQFSGGGVRDGDGQSVLMVPKCHTPGKSKSSQGKKSCSNFRIPFLEFPLWVRLQHSCHVLPEAQGEERSFWAIAVTPASGKFRSFISFPLYFFPFNKMIYLFIYVSHMYGCPT